jgi:hypothetical protein
LDTDTGQDHQRKALIIQSYFDHLRLSAFIGGYNLSPAQQPEGEHCHAR